MDSITDSSSAAAASAAAVAAGIHHHTLPLTPGGGNIGGAPSIILITPQAGSSASGGNHGSEAASAAASSASISLITTLMQPLLESLDGISKTLTSMARMNRSDSGYILFVVAGTLLVVLWCARYFENKLKLMDEKMSATHTMLGKMMYRSQCMEAQLHQISEDSLSMRVDLLKNFMGSKRGYDDEDDEDESADEEELLQQQQEEETSEAVVSVANTPATSDKK